MHAMDRFVVWVRTALASERGANLVEYAILIALIVVISVAAITLIGEEVSSKFEPVADTL